MRATCLANLLVLYFGYSHNASQLQIMKLHIVQFCPASYLFLTCGYKCSQHPVLKHAQLLKVFKKRCWVDSLQHWP
jgi:hypothetical protein